MLVQHDKHAKLLFRADLILIEAFYSDACNSNQVKEIGTWNGCFGYSVVKTIPHSRCKHRKPAPQWGLKIVRISPKNIAGSGDWNLICCHMVLVTH